MNRSSRNNDHADQKAEQTLAADDSGQEPAASEAGTPGEVEELHRRVAELEDQFLRSRAEFQNYKRRTQDDIGIAAERGRAEVLLRMIDVLDDLRRSREAAEQAAAGTDQAGPLFEALKHGVDLVYRNFEDVLAAFGVREIEAVGLPFDENLHEALMQREGTDAASGIVVDEIQKGYTMGDRVLRHAKVGVAV